MGKIIVLRGLPGSGKSYAAKLLLEEIGNSVRVNKDNLREMTFFSEWSGKREDVVDRCEMQLIEFLLSKGKVPIVDDCNLGNRVNRIKNIFFQHRVDVYDVDTNYKECIRRDSSRVGKARVGKSVITNMALVNGLVLDKPVVLVDIDGTVADCSHRLHHVKNKPTDWGAFFDAAIHDQPRLDVITDINFQYPAEKYHRVMMSGRPSSLKKVTEHWLDDNFQGWTTLIMRAENDYRNDDIVKAELARKYLNNQTIVAAWDDRPRIIRVWEWLGIKVHDVGPGIDV